MKAAGGAGGGAGAGAAGAPTWRDRLRSLLCCLAPPAKDPYYRGSDHGSAAARPPAPTPPPRHSQSHVLGPVAPQVPSQSPAGF